VNEWKAKPVSNETGAPTRLTGVGDKQHRYGVRVNTISVLEIWPYLIGPKIRLLRLLLWGWQQLRNSAVKGRTNYHTVRSFALEDGVNLPSFPDQLANSAAPFRRQIADLNTPVAEHRDRSRVGRILRLGYEMNTLAWAAKLDLEASAGTALVRVVDTHHHQRHIRKRH
jgi:hypothetical protein